MNIDVQAQNKFVSCVQQWNWPRIPLFIFMWSFIAKITKISETGRTLWNSSNWIYQKVNLIYINKDVCALSDNWINIFQEKFEDTKGVIRIRKLKKDRQYSGQKKKDNRTNNDLQSATQKTNDWATRALLKTRGELRWSRRVSSSCSISGTRHATLVTNSVISHAWGKNREVLMTSGIQCVFLCNA